MRLKRILMLSPILFLQGCLGGDSGGSSDDTATGQLTITGIEGLSYQTQSQTGITDERGRFQYYPGETISLSVGDMALVSDIPTDRIITPLQFLPATRQTLQSAIEDDLGLLSHKPAEKTAIENTTLRNITRFLLVLDSNASTSDDNRLRVTDRVISQINQYLPALKEPIDFTVAESEFANTTEDEFDADDPAGEEELTPVNKLLEKVCFYPEDDDLCEDPPTLAEIAAAPAPPEDGAPRDPDVEYSDELQSKRDRILNAIRVVEDIGPDDIDEYLLSELDNITTDRANEYYLSQVTANMDATDTSIKEVFIRRAGKDVSLASIEAISTDPSAVVVHSFNAQTHSVEYFIAGEPGDESDLIINFKPDDDYRWLRKPLRVVIE